MARVMEFDKTASGRELALAVGDQLHLTLPETRSGGFHWQLRSAGSPVLRVKDGGSQRAAGIGGSGVHRWTLIAAQKGTAKFELSYGRSWEASAKEHFTLTLKVGE